MNKVFTFWEGEMPAYIKLCMKSWNFPFVLLNYDNVNEYTNLQLDKIKKYDLPIQADIIRVHVLRDNGGYWLDADTIVVNGLPKENIFGYDIENREKISIGFLKTEKQSKWFKDWAEYQRKIYMNEMKPQTNRFWACMGNDFIDDYVKQNTNILIGDKSLCLPEHYMIDDNDDWLKYQKFYFENDYHINDLRKDTKIIMLHNSWTPDWYKKLNENDVLNKSCTLSNFLNESINNNTSI